VIRDLQFTLHMHVGRYPFLYYQFYAHRYPYREMRVTRKTQLCIEGFPRSANSYAVVAFKFANPFVKIAHHLHVPAQVLRAVQWGIPSIVCIRHPIEAVSSFLVFQNSTWASGYLRLYRFFYEALIPIMNRILIVDFQTIVDDVNVVIEKLNQRFDLHYCRIPDLAHRKADIFRKLNQWHQRFFKGQRHRGLLPDEARKKQKECMRYLVENSSEYRRALEIYELFRRNSLGN